MPRFKVEPIESTGCRPYPESTFPILVDRCNIVVAQAVRVTRVIPVVDKLVSLRNVPVQTSTNGSNPQISRLILVHLCDVVSSQAGGIIGVVLVVGDLSGLQIEPIEPTAVCANPEPIVSIYAYGLDQIIAEAIGIFRIVFVDHKLVPVVPVQPILRTEPYEPLTVLKDVQHHTLRESLLSRDTLKANAVVLGRQQGY